jgi:hypothetical protein
MKYAETKEYSKFSYFDTNRKVTDNKKLEQAIVKAGYIKKPISVTKDFKIVDGQHRFAIAKKLGLTVPYVVDQYLTEADMIMLNTTANDWKPINYVENLAKNGNENYQILLKAHNDYKISLVVLAGIAEHETGITPRISQLIKDGEIIIDDKDEFNEKVEFLNAINVELKALNRDLRKDPFKLAIANLYGKIDPKRLVKKIVAMNDFEFEQFRDSQGKRVVLFKIVDLYNSGTGRFKKIKYTLDTKGNMEIL